MEGRGTIPWAILTQRTWRRHIIFQVFIVLLWLPEKKNMILWNSNCSKSTEIFIIEFKKMNDHLSCRLISRLMESKSVFSEACIILKDY